MTVIDPVYGAHVVRTRLRAMVAWLRSDAYVVRPDPFEAALRAKLERITHEHVVRMVAAHRMAVALRALLEAAEAHGVEVPVECWSALLAWEELSHGC